MTVNLAKNTTVNKYFELSKSPPIWLWSLVFLISIAGTFYFGFNPNFIEKWWLVLATYNGVMSLVAFVYIVLSIKQLKKNTKNNIIGSSFTWYFIKIIPILVIVPVLSFYIFSFQSIQDNVNKSEKTFIAFNKVLISRVDNLYKDIQTIIDNRYVQQTERLLTLIIYYGELQKDEKTYNKNMQIFIESLVKKNWACQITLIDHNNNIIGQTGHIDDCGVNNTALSTDASPNKQDMVKASLSSDYINKDKTTQNLAVEIIYPVDLVLLNFSQRVKYFSDVAKSVKFSANTSITSKRFIIDLSSTILLTILSALMIIFNMIQRLIQPLHNLSLATKEISKGNYDVVVDSDKKNKDMRELIKYFNNMATQIKLSREGLDTHNLYLETILKYSFGVIGLDKNKGIQLINPIIGKMLNISPEKKFIGKMCSHIVEKHLHLQQLFTMAIDKFEQNLDNWDEEIEISLINKKILLSCQGAVLHTDNQTLGYVIIIKDISQLHKAQKQAAWGEVAIRMAHEIKNPLTPILLSAQRLRNKFLEVLTGNNLNIMDKTTNTIIDQVKSMDAMVSAFVDYANMPKIKKKPCDLNILIKKSVALYDAQNNINIRFDLSKNLPTLLLDANSVSRIIINLIKNSCEANTTNDNDFTINITSKHLPEKNIVYLKIEDNGGGFNKYIIDTVFEPYTTTKVSGNGLGLSIVQNIVEQHGGQISAANAKPHGAIIIIEFNY